MFPDHWAAAIGVDLALSKTDGITKLGEHLKALLAPADPPIITTPEVDPAQKPV